MNSSPSAPTSPDPVAQPPGRWGWRLAQGVAGIVVGLALAEGLFWWRDQGAFPHLNIYRTDPQVGLHLRPHAEQALRFGGAEVTHVRTNSLGFRGEEWPPPTPPGAPKRDVLVLGDSQVFGLGVEANQTFSAVLGQTLAAPVLNAGVPTWGPPEYNLALAELLEQRHPRLVIWVVNTYNDFFEAERPNAARHAVLDGWAVRRELAPEPAAFPGREWLFSNSHAVYALRRWLYGRNPDPNALGAPSEGTWRDLVGASAPVREERKVNAVVQRESLHVRDDELQIAEQALVAAQAQVERLASRFLPSAVTFPGDGVTLATVRSTPGDIVDYGDGGENARPGPVTVDHIRMAVKARNRAVALLRERAAQGGEKVPPDQAKEEAKTITGALDKEASLSSRLDALRDQPVILVRALSPLARQVQAAKVLCDRAGAELLVLALPMDVQVSSDEWAKYGAAPVDLEPSRVLLTDVVESAEALGAKGLDATDALRKAGAGAFLPRDLHLSVKGHAAVAAAVATRLTQYRPRLPQGGLPRGRSRAPSLVEWKSVGETLVHGSTVRACATKRIREWLSLWCTEGDGYQSSLQAAHRVELVKGGRGEAILARWEGPWVETDYYPYRERVVEGKHRTQLVLVAPVLPGDELIADFFWPGKKSRLVVRLPKELEAQTVEFQKFVDEESTPLPISKEAQALCDCQLQLSGARDCLALAAMPNRDCQQTWGNNCAALVGCSAGDPAYAPHCPPGSGNGGALDHCFPLCGPNRSCGGGAHCVDWQGGELCMPEPLAAPSAGVKMVVAAIAASPRTVELARAAVRAGAAAVKDCKLVNVNEPSAYLDVFDQCPVIPEAMSTAVTAARALVTHLAQHPDQADGRALLLGRRAAVFADWIELAQSRRFTRGTLPLFAELCGVWNEWQPKEPIDPYGEAFLAQYKTGLRTKGRQGTPVWVNCKTGSCL